MLDIFIVSDSTGETATRVINSALVQFKDAPVNLIRRGEIRTDEQVKAVIEEAMGHDSVILHTLVADHLRRYMLTESRKYGVDAMDLIGPVLERLATHLKITPQEKPGLYKQLTEARSREIEAVDFAFHHDDGEHIEELSKAEIILVGVSRTMKTPVMLYLAYRGWFAGNVPLIPEIPLPEELIKLSSERIFFLSMNPYRLLELRKSRTISQQIPDTSYASIERIRKELRYSHLLCVKYGWHPVDVTGKPVEEVVWEILATLPNRKENQI